MKRAHLDGTVAASAAAAVYRVQNTACPVLHQVRDVPDRVSVRQKIPASSTVSVVVQPGAEDEVCGGTEESPTRKLLAGEGHPAEKDGLTRRQTK